MVDLAGWRRHAARYTMPGWRVRTGRYTLAEGFSENLPMTFMAMEERRGTVLDPFAGAGTTLLAAARSGWAGAGVEMMPLGRFLVDSYRSLDSLGYEADAALAGMPEALDGIGDPTEMMFAAMHQASHADCEDARLACAFATLCALDILRRQVTLPAKCRATPVDAMEEVCERLGQLAGNAYAGIAESRMLEGDCRTALRRMPENKFDMVVTSPPFFGRWDGGMQYALEHEIVALAADSGCYDGTRGLRPALRWRDDGMGAEIVAQLGVEETSRELVQHCRMLGWLMATSAGVLEKNGILHMVIENPVLEGRRRALDEATCSCAASAGFGVELITRLPSFKEMMTGDGLRSVSVVSMRL
jgi:hypothetical protein